VSYSVSTGGWTSPRHYHLIFRGKSSGASYCGHYDIEGSQQQKVPALRHGDAELK
jgi:hypothetical protein